MQCTKSCLIKNTTSFLLFCSCSVVAWDYEPVFRGYRGEEAYSTLHPRSIGRNLVRWGGLGYIPMRKLKKKIEISFPIAFGTEFEMVVLVTPSISLSIRSVFFLIFNLPLLKQETLFGDLPNIEKICCIAAFYYVQGAAWVIMMANG